MGAIIGPALGHEALTFIHGYPASQAALARLDPHDPRTAQRFELYLAGIELANGFHELASADEQRARFAQDLRERERRGLPVHAMDERLLAALGAGLPECAGVAVGFDRVLMLAAGAAHIREVLPFPTRNGLVHLLLGARDVLAGAGIDADDFTLVDEQRHAHDGAGFQLRRLLTAGGGVAAQTRIGLDDLQFDMRAAA